MFSISQALARQLRAVFRRTLGSSLRRPGWLQVATTDSGYTVRGSTPEVALEYRHTAQVEPLSCIIPLDLLAAGDGKSDDLVRFSVVGDGPVTAHWETKGIPQEKVAEQPESLPEFPACPQELSANEPVLLTAIVDAMATTDPGSSRYALGCINLRGSTGSIAATDGGQLLVQNGFDFPWREDVLVPTSKFFLSREISRDQPIEVGRYKDWAVFRTGRWTLWLRINTEGRFPKIDDVVQPATTFQSHIRLSERDATFARDAVPRLSSQAECGHAVTLDLNGEVIIRSRADSTTPPTELLLAESHLDGSPIRFVAKQANLSRALAMGLRDFHFRTPESFAQAQDDRRTYICMPLNPDLAVPARPDSRRISSVLAKRVIPHKHIRTVPLSTEPVAVREQPRPEVSMAVKPHSDYVAPQSSPIEAAVALRGVLREVLTKTNDLVRTLKRQKRQSQLVKSTLDSLKQLQEVA